MAETMVSGWKISSTLATVVSASVLLAGGLIAVAVWVDSYLAKDSEFGRLRCELTQKVDILDARAEAEL